MKAAKWKDYILKYCRKRSGFGNTDKMSDESGISYYILYTLAEEIAADGYVKIESSVSLKNDNRCYSVTLLPSGRYFLRTGGYILRWWKNWLVDFPRTFWWIVAAITFWAGRDFKFGSKKDTTQPVQQ